MTRKELHDALELAAEAGARRVLQRMTERRFMYCGPEWLVRDVAARVAELNVELYFEEDEAG